jgi:hypothetical protein
MSLAAAVALLAFFLARRDKPLRVLSFIMIASLVLWSIAIGYIRYALHLELIAGILIVLAVAALVSAKESSMRALRMSLAGLLCLSLGVQAFLAMRYVRDTEWSQRPTLFQRPDIWKANARYTLRDHDLRSFLAPPDQKRIDEVDVWIETGSKANGMQLLLNRRAPIIGVRNGEHFVTRVSNERFAETLDRAAGKRAFTLCFAEDLESALGHLKSRGLEAAAQEPLTLPFYSPGNRLDLVLIEVAGIARAAELARTRPL